MAELGGGDGVVGPETATELVDGAVGQALGDDEGEGTEAGSEAGGDGVDLAGADLSEGDVQGAADEAEAQVSEHGHNTESNEETTELIKVVSIKKR